MTLELDHIFIAVSANAPEAELLPPTDSPQRAVFTDLYSFRNILQIRVALNQLWDIIQTHGKNP